MSNFPSGTIFQLTPFQPKRILILPCEGGEITLYVMDAQGYASVAQDRRGRKYNTLKSVHFSGWCPPFENTELVLPSKILHTDPQASGLPYCLVEAIFRMVPLEGRAQTAEVVALSFDECKTFYWNALSKLPAEYNE